MFCRIVGIYCGMASLVLIFTLPWDSLADAYMKAADNENAITNYQKSLDLNPKNQNAKDMLKKLEQGREINQ